MQAFYQVRAIRYKTTTVVRQLYDLQVSSKAKGKHLARRLFLSDGTFSKDWDIVVEQVPENFFQLMASSMKRVEHENGSD